MQKQQFDTLNRKSARGQWLQRFRPVPLAIVALTACGFNAHAGDADSGWRYAMSPYLWAAGIKGESGTLPGLPPADVDMSFGDIFDDLKFAGMLIATAQKGRFGFGGDLQYVKTSAGVDAAPPIFDDGKLTSETFSLSGWGQYALFDDERSNLKLAAGARLWSVDTELKLSGGLVSRVKIKHDETWVDPMLGVIGKTDVSPKFFLQGWGFVGGFGVGSDTMIDLFGGVGYRISDKTSTTIGYRWLKLDYDNDDFLYDVRQQGIVAGMTFRF